MASCDKNAVLEFVLFVFILPVGVLSLCETSKMVTEFNDMAFRADAALLGTVMEKIPGPDSAFPDQDKSFGFKFQIDCIYQNKKRKSVSLATDSVIYGGGARDDGTNCHNITLPMGEERVLFVKERDDGKLVAVYASLEGALLEELAIYCFLENKVTSDDGTGIVDEDVCFPVLASNECTSYEGSNSGVVITEKPPVIPTTKKPTAEPKPEPTTKKPEGTTKKPDPGYTVKNGKAEPEPKPGTKGGQTVDGSGNGSSVTHYSSVSLGLLFCISLVLF